MSDKKKTTYINIWYIYYSCILLNTNKTHAVLLLWLRPSTEWEFRPIWVRRCSIANPLKATALNYFNIHFDFVFDECVWFLATPAILYYVRPHSNCPPNKQCMLIFSREFPRIPPVKWITTTNTAESWILNKIMGKPSTASRSLSFPSHLTQRRSRMLSLAIAIRQWYLYRELYHLCSYSLWSTLTTNYMYFFHSCAS